VSNSVDIQIKVLANQATNTLKQLDTNLKNNTKSVDNLTKSTTNASRAFDVFKGVIGAQAVTAGLRAIRSAATSLFNTFIVDGVKAAQVQEDAINALNIALKATGKFSTETSKDIQQFASELQKASKFGDEVILQNAALIQSLGDLETDGLKRATKAAVDMSAALGIDLTSAATLVGKAAAGEVGSFSRYGIIIEKGADSAKTFENALTQLEKKFGGAALGQINTFSGAYQQLSNQFGDLTEQVGFLITKNEGVVAGFKVVSKAVSSMQDALENNRETITGWIKNGIIIAIEAVQGFVRSLNGIVGATRVIWNALTILYNSIKIGFEVVMGGITGAFAAVIDGFIFALKKLPSSIVPTGWVENLELASAALSSATKDSASSIADSTNSIIGDLEDIGNSFENLIDEDTINTINSRLDEVKDAVINAKQAVVEENQNNLKTIATQAEEEKAIVIDKVKEISQAEINAFIETQQERLAYIKDVLGEEEFLKESARARELAARGDFIAAENSIEAARVRARRNDIFAIQKFEELSQKERIQNIQSTLQVISTLQQSGSRRLFEVGKAAAIAQATIDGFAAAQRALASAPPPLNFALAGIVGVATAANISNIASQQPRFQNGGIVGGQSFNGDQISARVNSGEMILNRQQQANLFKMANNGGAGQQEIVIHTTVELDGEAVGRSVSRQVANGLQLGEVQ